MLVNMTWLSENEHCKQIELKTLLEKFLMKIFKEPSTYP